MVGVGGGEEEEERAWQDAGIFSLLSHTPFSTPSLPSSHSQVYQALQEWIKLPTCEEEAAQRKIADQRFADQVCGEVWRKCGRKACEESVEGWGVFACEEKAAQRKITDQRFADQVCGESVGKVWRGRREGGIRYERYSEEESSTSSDPFPPLSFPSSEKVTPPPPLASSSPPIPPAG